ncbi:MAG: hypothetical protein GPJ54_22150 [Candidatus Heimdallarchaeota archaeon]|nr:hypothetical protein [Candidatus Heimdallarchaeota archaeon]
MRDKERELGFDESCPNCNSKNVVREIESEYNEAGYAISSDAYECQNCGHVWRGEEFHE